MSGVQEIEMRERNEAGVSPIVAIVSHRATQRGRCHREWAHFWAVERRSSGAHHAEALERQEVPRRHARLDDHGGGVLLSCPDYFDGAADPHPGA
jgi:hypothetical protein